MTGTAKSMEKAGFILRKSDPGDARVTMLEITSKGRKTLKKIEKEKDEWLEILLKGFSKQGPFCMMRPTPARATYPFS